MRATHHTTLAMKPVRTSTFSSGLRHYIGDYHG
jgi:hypothetical protein